MRAKLGAPREKAQEIIERRNGADTNPVRIPHFLHRRSFALSALHAIQRDQHAGRRSSVRPDHVNRFSHRGTGRDDVVK